MNNAILIFRNKLMIIESNQKVEPVDYWGKGKSTFCNPNLSGFTM